MTKVAVTSVGCENLARRNICLPNGWRYFGLYDRVNLAEYNPDLLVIIGWFCAGWGDWQAHMSAIGDIKKVVIHWVGSDILQAKNDYQAGFEKFLKTLDTSRYLHIAPTSQSMKELVYSDGKPMFTMHGPIDIPAEGLIEKQPQPDDLRIAVYMPPDRQDFYGMKVLNEVLPTVEDATIVFYHWLPDCTGLDYKGSHEEHYALSRKDYEEKILKGCSLLVRVPMHDAGSISVGEFFMAGKPVVVNQTLPKWKYGIRSPMYKYENGGFLFLENAEQKLASELKTICDLVKNGNQPVPDETVEFYRSMYDPSLYAGRIAEYCKEHGWEGLFE